jgi:hypothetical protein
MVAYSAKAISAVTSPASLIRRRNSSQAEYVAVVVALGLGADVAVGAAIDGDGEAVGAGLKQPTTVVARTTATSTRNFARFAAITALAPGL